jgi:hypothetical protein
MEASCVQVNTVVMVKVLAFEQDISDIHVMNLFSSVMLLMLKGHTSCPSRATI